MSALALVRSICWRYEHITASSNLASAHIADGVSLFEEPVGLSQCIVSNGHCFRLAILSTIFLCVIYATLIIANYS